MDFLYEWKTIFNIAENCRAIRYFSKFKNIGEDQAEILPGGKRDPSDRSHQKNTILKNNRSIREVLLWRPGKSNIKKHIGKFSRFYMLPESLPQVSMMENPQDFMRNRQKEFMILCKYTNRKRFQKTIDYMNSFCYNVITVRQGKHTTKQAQETIQVINGGFYYEKICINFRFE